MPEPVISVVMGVYNNAPYLAEAIESVLAQTFRDFEFLIVNDGSTDGSGAIVDAFSGRDPRIRALHQPNRGLVLSLNRCLDEARAPMIARMDGDDVSMPERFDRQLKFLSDNPAYGVVGTSTHDIDRQGRVRLNEDYHPLSHEAFLAVLDGGPLLCHPSVLMRAEHVRAAGAYRRAYRHCEDYDLWLRLAERTKLCSIPDRLLYYRRSDTQVSNMHTMEQHVNAAIAWIAYQERIAGRPDPTGGLDAMPPIECLDSLFGRAGAGREVRAKVAPSILHSEEALLTHGLDLLLHHVREGGDRRGLWRTAGRLVKIGAPARAARLAATLATA